MQCRWHDLARLVGHNGHVRNVRLPDSVLRVAEPRYPLVARSSCEKQIEIACSIRLDLTGLRHRCRGLSRHAIASISCVRQPSSPNSEPFHPTPGYGSSDFAISPYVHKRNTKNEIQQLKSNELTELVGIYFIINRLGLTVS